MNFVMNLVGYAFKMVGVIAAAPFLALGYAVVKLTGGDPMSMDGMGIDFIIMVIVAIVAAIAVGSFSIGYLI